MLAEFSLWVCSCKCSGRVCETCRDLTLFGLISLEICPQSLPTLPFASHDHGSGQLLNAGVSSPWLSIALDTYAARESSIRRVPYLQFMITRHNTLAVRYGVLIPICPLISERVRSDDFLHSTNLCGHWAFV